MPPLALPLAGRSMVLQARVGLPPRPCAARTGSLDGLVAERVRQGGHDIPKPVIRRRFAAGPHNFRHHFSKAVNDWALYDNAGNAPVLLEWGENP